MTFLAGFYWPPTVILISAWLSVVMKDEFSLWFTKITSRIGVSWIRSLPFCFWPIFNSMNYGQLCPKPDNFESHNSLKLRFMNIQGLRSNFVEFESFFESKSLDILAVCETNVDDSIDSVTFLVRGYLPLIWKGSVTYVHGIAVYVNEGLPFA